MAPRPSTPRLADSPGSPTPSGSRTRTAAVLGTGRMARVHLRCYRKHPAVERVVVWGRNESALAAFCRGSRNTHYFLDFGRMLEVERPFVLSVCLTPDVRERVIVPALEGGSHVLCEKPVALSLDEAARIRDAAERTSRFVMVGYVLRFLPEIRSLKALIDAGDIGEVRFVFFRNGRGFRRVEWFNDPARSLGVFGELGIHGIDLVRHFVGDEIASVKSETIRSLPDRRVPDNGSVLLRFKRGAIAQVTSSLSYPFFESDLVVIGTREVVRVVGGRLIRRSIDVDESPRRLFLRSLGEGFRLPWRQAFSSPYAAEIDHFLECARTNTEPACSIRHDLEVLRACLQASAGAV